MALQLFGFGKDAGKKNVIGIDISSASVKLLELSRQKKGYRVESFGIAPLQQGAVVEKNINDPSGVASAIRRALAIAKSKSKDAVVAVSGSSVITKIVQMDSTLNDDAMETQIALEADQYIPYPLEEVAVDFEIQGPAEQAGMVDVLVAACRRDNVDMRVDALSEAGLTAKVVDLEAYAVERVYSFLSQHQAAAGGSDVIAVVDMGASMTTLNVVANGSIVYMREQLFGGRLLTEDIQRRFSMSFEEAEAAQINGTLPDEYRIEILEPFKMSVVQHISRALQFFFSSGQHQTVDQVLLAGGIASLEGMGEVVQERLGVPVQVVNPFQHMQIAPKVNSNELQKMAPSLLIACGLALRDI